MTRPHLLNFAGKLMRRGKAVQASIWLLAWVTLTFGLASTCDGQLIDALDAYPPRWSLHSSDCDARIIEQTHHNDPIASGGRCEAITVTAQHGTKAILIYPIEPVQAINELTATVRCKALAKGVRIGLRVRFPNVIDPASRRPAAVMLFGSSYRRTGEFQTLVVGNIQRELNLKRIAMRRQYGPHTDVDSPYVDAVVLNAYVGQGTSTVRLDDLKVDAMVPLSDGATANDRSAIGPQSLNAARLPLDRENVTLPSVPTDSARPNDLRERAFPLGRVSRILQYNGEPLAWVRSLGFDGVWMSSPPTPSLLSEAIAARVSVYAAPPASPDPKLQPLLEPVAGWVIASELAVDQRNETEVLQRIERVRRFPTTWQRPLIACPVENHRVYGANLDAAVLDAPPRVRLISSRQTRRQRARQIRRLGECSIMLGVSSSPNDAAVWQTDAIANSIGSPTCDSFDWQSMWRQVADGLADRPDAILYRSSTPLTRGTLLEQNRAMALSYVNRFVAMLEPWIAGGWIDPDTVDLYASEDSTAPTYQAHRLVNGESTLIIMTSAQIDSGLTLAGDGKTLQISLPPGDKTQLAWRATGFSAERLTPVQDSTGQRIEIVSPDTVEVLLLSSDPVQGGRLASSATRFRQQAALDRLQLARESLVRVQMDWQQATALRLLKGSPPNSLMNVSGTTLEEAETLIRGDSAETGLRLARRADAWTMKSRWMLAEALRRDPVTGREIRYLSSPPLLAGNLETQISWSPLLWGDRQPQLGQRGAHWSSNLLPGGDFERSNALQREGWTLGRRHTGWVQSDAERTQRGAFSGNGALSIRATPRGDDPLPGGYEGTCLYVRSPPIRIRPGQAVRIDAMVRTLGFQDPHQGLLVYDSIGSQSLGVLARDCDDWTPVTLYRQSVDDSPLHVMLEVIGGGEAMIDDLQVRVWESELPTQTAVRVSPGSILE